MGYATRFSGVISLSRKLTFSEAKYLLEMNEDCAATERHWGICEYMHWVPTETLDGIVWDGNENFYDYIEIMQFLCLWFSKNDIIANGQLTWSGEEVSDTGTLLVNDNIVTSQALGKTAKSEGKPLSMETLAEMALAEVKKAQS